MLISNKKKTTNFDAENNSKQNSDRRSSKMDYSPCLNEIQRTSSEEKEKKVFERTLRDSIYILVYFEQKFYLDDFKAIQNILKFENLPAIFALENEKSSTQASVLKESLLMQNFCEGVFHKNLKQILLNILSEYKGLIKFTNCNSDFESNVVSDKDTKEYLDKVELKRRQEQRIKDLFQQLAVILNDFEFKRETNLEKNVNDAYVVLETLMHIFCSYFNFFRENFDFDFSAVTQPKSIKADAFVSSERVFDSIVKFDTNKQADKPFNDSTNNNPHRDFSLEQAKAELNAAYFTKENQSVKLLGIFDDYKKNQNPERKKAEGFNEKLKSNDQYVLLEEAQKSQAATVSSSYEEKAIEMKFQFLSLIFNLFEEENFLNLFNCLLFTLDKLKNKTFHGFYSVINQKFLITLFTSGKKSIKHFDNLISFSVFSKRILSGEKFPLYSKLLKITESKVNQSAIQCQYLDRIIFEYFLLNFKDENKTFTDKLSNLSGGLDNLLLFFSAFLEFWNKEKFYNVHNNIDFNTVFSNCIEALNQMINLLKPKLLDLLNELLCMFADPNKFLFKQNNSFYKYLDSISTINFKAFVDFLRQFICNHIFAAYVNDNNFEMINRTVWIKPVIDLFSLSNFCLKLLQISALIKTETDNFKNNYSDGDNYRNAFISDNRRNESVKINEELAYQFLAYAFSEMFDKIFSPIPLRMLYLREVYMLNFLFLFANFIEKTPFYLEYLRANPSKQIVSALEKIAKFQNKYFFLLSNHLVKLIFPDRKHKMRIYSFYNFPLDYLEIEESEILKSRIGEIIFGQVDTAQLLIEDRLKGDLSMVKNSSRDDDYTNPNNCFSLDEKNISITSNSNAPNFYLNNNDNRNGSSNCELKGNDFNYSSCSLNQQNSSSKEIRMQEEFIEQYSELNRQDKKINPLNCFYTAQPKKANNSAVNNPAGVFSNDTIIIDSILNNLNKPSIQETYNQNKFSRQSEGLIEQSKDKDSKTKNFKPKSLSKAQIKKRLSFQSEIFYDFSTIFSNFQFDHLKLLEKINNKKLKFNFLTKNNKIANLNNTNSQSFEYIVSSGEKVFLKVTSTKASSVLVQKEDEILFIDDSNFSQLKSFFGFDMVNKADLEYFLLIGKENLKDNELMLQNFLNNFDDWGLKNELTWDDVIENMYLFLD